VHGDIKRFEEISVTAATGIRFGQNFLVAKYKANYRIKNNIKLISDEE
jgi:hypothetical protein